MALITHPMPINPIQILVIEPDKSLRQRFSEHLRHCGFRVSCCGSGFEAKGLMAEIDWLSCQNDPTALLKPDVVLAELDLEGYSGIELLIDVKARSRATPVVLSSTDGAARDVVEALRKGVDDFIVKPLDDLYVLNRVIAKAMARADLEREHAQAQVDLKRLNLELTESMHALQRDQAAGRLVQERLLPAKDARFNGISLSFEIIPSSYLSGDAVDYGMIGGRYLAFYLTDVSGHGSASAFVTVWAKQLVRSFFRDQNVLRSEDGFNSDIPRLMRVLNEALIEANIGPHLTCFVGVIDTQTLKMNYVVGGHLPLPLLVNEEGVEVLVGQGKPLGLFRSATWQQNRIQLQDGFRLIAFSDGVLELMPGNDLVAEEEALMALITQINPHQLNQVYERLPLQNRDTVPDDVAMLFIRHGEQ